MQRAQMRLLVIAGYNLGRRSIGKVKLSAIQYSDVSIPYDTGEA